MKQKRITELLADCNPATKPDIWDCTMAPPRKVHTHYRADNKKVKYVVDKIPYTSMMAVAKAHGFKGARTAEYIIKSDDNKDWIILELP